MPSISSEQAVVEALIQRLKTVMDNVRLGYSAVGLESEGITPAIFVQLESLSELKRQGSKARYLMQFTIGVAVKTNENTTLELLGYNRAVRETLNGQWTDPAIRKLTLEETQFDIAPGNSQLSFADTTLTLEMIL